MATQEHHYDRTWLEEMKRNYPSHVRGGRLDRFVKAVESSPIFQSVYNQGASLTDAPDGRDVVDGTSISDSRSTTKPSPEQKTNLLFEAARTGCCATLTEFFDEKIVDVNLTYGDGLTALHIAAENGHYKDVKFLLEAGAEIEADKRGLTPLHVAASSAEPIPKIANCLIKHMNENASSLINATISETSNNESTEGNTALHCAADNKHISHEFIRALETCHILDPSIKNKKDKTAFHVAAEAENPEVIVSMLEVFTPAK